MASRSAPGFRQPAWRGPLRGGIALVIAGTLLAFALGFLSFVRTVAVEADAEGVAADGIVALTGGAERLADAVWLLERGRASRLLITGVNPATSGDELEKSVPRIAGFTACCVDIDRRATTTVGNAVETRRWVEDRGFRSVIVVTSGYHMPRALKELARALPDVTLIPYPVVTERLRSGAWWQDPDTVRVLVEEYVKYLIVSAKIRFVPPGAGDFAAPAYAARL
jgi:uncharacterized SAM-binding protein YcdF (DUF218 family)